ncbi:hypothetical protein E2C01_098458 [Portunus trituberculatus]|uniref:Uncharacterized protein n=1 Tax=Portunus trituberculatus TaxID=210409 RepID=A0A5B7JXV8_PORTR|nr:hypothetical protein [Portunus trituberculatus]
MKSCHGTEGVKYPVTKNMISRRECESSNPPLCFPSILTP